ncbi:glycoside hydrolase family 2 TIM barrel-domain containing protein [Chitinophaga sp. CC14]|uniref:glycoside hydrolase family 2 protein n=1 Tax=Chitinophaga sp. CC14 TaxID=3029199 RepID=UPI003B7D7C66
MRKIFISIGFLALISFNCYAQYKKNDRVNYQMSPLHMQSRWAAKVSPDNALKEYPRPQLQRKNWENLNGLWEYSITDSSETAPSNFEGVILVPYPIESALSGVQKKLMPDKCLWYKKYFEYPKSIGNERILLNFGAIDWKATILINKKEVGQHTGGYQNFSYDITDFLKPGSNEVLIKVYDPSDKGINPHGKQVLNPANIYYTSSSGIWQTVWLEKVSPTHITSLKTTPDIDNSLVTLKVNISGKIENTWLEISTLENEKLVSKTKIKVTQNQENNIINIPNMRLWSPDDPFLYDLSIKIICGGKTLDEVKSYFGMRKINIQKDEKGTDRIFLNNKYTYNLGILDQGFWPEGLYTAPTDEALAFDIKAIKSLGFNTIRKHIKIEPERWYYYADKIGVLVWQDFVNPPHGLPEGSRVIFEKEVQTTIDQLYNHPCIVIWVLFNERWGAYDQERLTKWVKSYDPSRIVNGHSGELLYVDNQLRDPAENPWVASDLTDVHSYPEPRLPPARVNKARVVGEFGGIGVPVPGHEWDDMQGWGYVQATASELKGKYIQMIEDLKKLEKVGLSASIYTQPFDVEGEENGLLTYDREVIKISVTEMRKINQEIVKQTSGFNLDTNFFIATNININDNDSRYDEFLSEYRNGKRDSAFLRRLISISIRRKDQENTTALGNTYISTLSQPYSKENLTFIRKITKTTKDKGFDLFMQHPQKVDSALWETAAISKVKSIIDYEEVAPYVKENPNWDSIQQKVSNKYGAVGEELILGKRMIYYGVESKNKDWKNFAKYYVLYFEKALAHPEYDINNMTWYIYENVNDPIILEFAIDVLKYAIEKWDQSPEAYDTYAQLLHKTKKSSEAIKWEEKALQLGKGTQYEKVYAETLQKMKAGLPTWPQNN